MNEMRPNGLRHNGRIPDTSLTNKKMSEITERSNVIYSKDDVQSEWTKRLIELMMSKYNAYDI